MVKSAAKTAYDTTYNKEKMTRFCCRWHNVNDADIIAKLETVHSKADYIRQLIRADIAKETGEKE